tara:strand:- start:498 stop:1733 length:1236 start_codon:yes stop_codon:yes gene_type:complete
VFWAWFFFILLLVCWLRWLALLLFAGLHIRRHRKPTLQNIAHTRADWPKISILIPAYNEQDVIAHTLDTFITPAYPQLEVFAIDDGSTDQTAHILREYGDTYPHIHPIIMPQNGGKSEALNAGIAQSTSDIVITMDADTLLDQHALFYIAEAFDDPSISAVACNIKLGNRHNALTLWQSIEYITSINIERRAQSLFHCITTLPGAASGYRRAALQDVGGFSSDTVTEDADITLCLLTKGHKLYYEERAIAWTEAPEKTYDLFKQRVRWITGCFQCLWKHRLAWYHTPMPAFRWFGFPNLLFLNTAILIFLPIFIYHIVTLCFAFSITGLLFVSTLFLPDLVCSVCGYHFDREDMGELRHFVTQRFFYMGFFGYIFLVIGARALAGSKTKWNKLPRSGTWMETSTSSSPPSS